MRNSNPLKQALQDLKIHEAFKLKGKSLSFKAPKEETLDSNTPLVSNSTQNHLLTKDQNQSKDNLQSKVDLLSDVKNTSLDNNGTHENSTKVTNVSQDLNSTMDNIQTKDISESLDISNDSAMIDRSTQPRKATNQDEAIVIANRVNPSLRKGFTKLPNDLLFKIVEGDLSKAEIKLLLLILRFTVSFGQDTVPMSKSVIEKYTGLQGKSILDALFALENKKLILKIKGDPHKPNRLGLILPENGLDKKATMDEKKSQREEPHTDISSPHYKDIYININKSPLSQGNEKLRKYLAELKPERKRDEEFRNFQNLGKDYSEDEISLCFEFLQKHGSLKTNEPCHSPMAYLLRAMNEVLQEASKQKEGEAKKLLDEQKLAKEQQEREEQEYLAEKHFLRADSSFSSFYPTEEAQRLEIERILREELVGKYIPKHLQRRFAIQKWFELRTKENNHAVIQRNNC